jgi:IclR family transcriptional regulator, KDG regulon repressor
MPEATTTSRTSGSERLLTSAMKCLALLDVLAAEPGAIKVTELARRLDTRRGTLYQQLQTLVAAGWVEEDQHAQYRLTLHALSIGTAVLEQANLGSRVLPTLTALAARSGETASIAVLDRDAAMIVQRVAADRELKVDIKPGTRMPLADSASGRILLAFCQGTELDRARASGARFPSEAVLDAARRSGYACQRDEWVAGMSSIAVPLTPTHLGSGALAITAPTGRFDEQGSLQELERAATEIGGLLGQ